MFLERELISRRNSGRKIDIDKTWEPPDNIELKLKQEHELQEIVEIKTALKGLLWKYKNILNIATTTTKI